MPAKKKRAPRERWLLQKSVSLRDGVDVTVWAEGKGSFVLDDWLEDLHDAVSDRLPDDLAGLDSGGSVEWRIADAVLNAKPKHSRIVRVQVLDAFGDGVDVWRGR